MTKSTLYRQSLPDYPGSAFGYPLKFPWDICDRTWEKGPIGVVDHFFIFLHLWNLRFITSLWIPERMLEVLPSLSYRRLNTRSYKDRKRQKSIFNVSGQIERSFRARPCHERAWVKKGCCLLCSVRVCVK